MTLADLPTGRRAWIVDLTVPVLQPGWARQLEDLGFAAGEPVTVLRRAVPGGDPLVVRVGASTYAQRRAEAACVNVVPVQTPAEAHEG
jgi:ferrous iron transport protein A